MLSELATIAILFGHTVDFPRPAYFARLTIDAEQVAFQIGFFATAAGGEAIAGIGGHEDLVAADHGTG